MNIKYICTFWGCENQTAKEFLSYVISNGYDGVEINFPDNSEFIDEFKTEIENIRATINTDFIFIAQQVVSNKKETVNEYIHRITERLEFLAKLKPDFINSHTGKDYYDFSDNCKIIEITDNLSKKYNVPIIHEIHRGRFSFHLKTLQRYLELFPKLNLVADFSHFCVVSESNLEDQTELLTKIYPKIKHLHARIGFEQSPQVNDPFAPEWQSFLDRYLIWWKDIIEYHKKRNCNHITITPEFGPFPYMPEEPFTKKPLVDQWETNLQMKKYLQQNL